MSERASAAERVVAAFAERAAGFFVAVVLAGVLVGAAVFLDALFAATLADVGGCFAVVFFAVALRFAGRGVVMVQPPAAHLHCVAG